MHEASLAKDVFDLLVEIISQDEKIKGKKIRQIIFSLSRPNTVMPESFEMFFKEIIKGTLLDGVELIFKEGEKKGFFISSIIMDDGE